MEIVMIRNAVFLSALTLVATVSTAGAAQAQFKLTSPDIKPGGTIPDEQVFNGFGCSGKNISSALKWSGAPKETKGFALLVHDPDAPTGGAGWWHWALINIPAGTTRLGKDAGKVDGYKLPSGCARLDTVLCCPARGDPCPPAGDTPALYPFTANALRAD